MHNFHVNIDKMGYTCLILSSLICFMLYKGSYVRLMCLACDVTAMVKEGQQYPGPGIHREISVAPKHIYSPVNISYDLKQIATEFFSAGMHSGEVSLKHTKNPLRHLSGKQVKSAIKVTFSH